MATSTSCKLVFKLANDNDKIINVSNSRSDIDATETNAVGAAIVAAPAFFNTGNDDGFNIASYVEARIETVTTTVVN